jgi:hypothetical protein
LQLIGFARHSEYAHGFGSIGIYCYVGEPQRLTTIERIGPRTKLLPIGLSVAIAIQIESRAALSKPGSWKSATVGLWFSAVSSLGFPFWSLVAVGRGAGFVGLDYWGRSRWRRCAGGFGGGLFVDDLAHALEVLIQLSFCPFNPCLAQIDGIGK